MTNWRPDIWPDGTNPYEIEIRILDNNKATIGWLPHTNDDNQFSWSVVSRLEDPLAVTPESKGDYVQSTLPDQSWRTDQATDESKIPNCSVGHWDCSDEPCVSPSLTFSTFFEDVSLRRSLVQYRELDCSFDCAWHGGPPSDGGTIQY